MHSNDLSLHLKQILSRPINWIFTEGDGIESRLSFKIFSTLSEKISYSRFVFNWGSPIELWRAPDKKTLPILFQGRYHGENSVAN